MPPTRSAAACVAGLLVGASFVAATPALAATSADCLPGNSVDAATQTGADIQTLLTAGAPIICLSGTFVLSAPLVGEADVELFGLSAAVLDGSSAVRILQVTGPHVLKVENIRFTRGVSASDGGALSAATVQIAGSTFDHNTAVTGGAVRAAAVTITGSTFEDNAATGNNGGGGVFFDTSATVVDSEFRRNTAVGGFYGAGGAISSYSVLGLVSGSTFEDNTAVNGGGAIRSGGVTVEESTFARNTTTDVNSVGGAIFTGAYTVTNSTFVENSAPHWAGAIYGGQATVSQSTFLNNSAPSGLSLWVRNFTPGTSRFSGNIFASTSTAQQIVDYDGRVSADLGGNIFSSTSPEHGFVANDPTTLYGIAPAALFGANALADNGGQVPTLALIPGSPAIDLVPAGSPVTTDARPWNRVAANDAGAYELAAVDPNAPAPPVVVPAAPTLPATGSEAGWLGALSALLLAAGAVVLTAVRRQRRA